MMKVSKIVCESGCVHFTGGEIRHHKDCQHYPNSFSQMYDTLVSDKKMLLKAIDKLKKDRSRLETDLGDAMDELAYYHSEYGYGDK